MRTTTVDCPSQKRSLEWYIQDSAFHQGCYKDNGKGLTSYLPQVCIMDVLQQELEMQRINREIAERDAAERVQRDELNKRVVQMPTGPAV